MSQEQHAQLLVHVQNYFEDYLLKIRGASPHTIRAYGNSLKLFFLFLSRRKKSSIAHLQLPDITVGNVLAFLEHLEANRSNKISTRNSRLAAIRSFNEHLLRHDLTRAEQYRRILTIPSKKFLRRQVTYLEPEEFQKIYNQIENLRDQTLLLFLYNTGARISEALAVCPRDLHLIKPRQVRLLGKGNKERYCPLWSETANLLKKLIGSEFTQKQSVFRNQRGAPLTRDGAAYILSKHVLQAAKKIKILRKKRVTPHILRHSCAVALLQSGVDLTVIRDYLGHSSISTTNHYVTSNLDAKKKVLQAFWKTSGLSKSTSSWKPSADLLAFLESL